MGFAERVEKPCRSDMIGTVAKKHISGVAQRYMKPGSVRNGVLG